MLVSLSALAAGSAICGSAPSMQVLITGRGQSYTVCILLHIDTNTIRSDPRPRKRWCSFHDRHHFGRLGSVEGARDLQRGDHHVRIPPFGSLQPLNFTFTGRTPLLAVLGPLSAVLWRAAVIGVGSFVSHETPSLALSSISAKPELPVIVDLNLPICGLSASLILAFLKLQRPARTLREKLSQMDWMYVLPRPCSYMRTQIVLQWQRDSNGFCNVLCYRADVGWRSVFVEFIQGPSPSDTWPFRFNCFLYL